MKNFLILFFPFSAEQYMRLDMTQESHLYPPIHLPCRLRPFEYCLHIFPGVACQAYLPRVCRMRLFDQQFCLPVAPSLLVYPGLSFMQLYHLPAAFMFYLTGHLPVHSGRFRPRPPGILEDVRLVKSDLFYKIIGLLEFSFCLPGKSHDDVCRQGWICKMPPQDPTFFPVFPRGISAVHPF